MYGEEKNSKTHLPHTERSGLEGDIVGDDDQLATIGVLGRAHRHVPRQHPHFVGAHHPELLGQRTIGLQHKFVRLEELRAPQPMCVWYKEILWAGRNEQERDPVVSSQHSFALKNDAFRNRY